MAPDPVGRRTARTLGRPSIHPTAHPLKLGRPPAPALDHESQRLAQSEVARAVPGRVKGAQEFGDAELAPRVQQAGNCRQEFFAGGIGPRKKSGGDAEELNFDQPLVRMGCRPLHA
jgi:hypothetical protein